MNADHRAVLIAGIGAVATIAAAVIAAVVGHAQGQSEATPGPTVTATTTVTAGPTVTVTPGTSSGGGSTGGTSSASFPGAGQGGKVWTVTMPLSSNSVTGLDVDHGHVVLDSNEDIDYTLSNDGTPEIVKDEAAAISLDVAAQNAGKQQCMTATTSSPDASAITGIRRGMLFCVSSYANRGVALMEVTQSLGRSQVLHLRETYWPTSSQ